MNLSSKEDVKNYLRDNKVLVKYLRDVYGNKNGVVVAIGAGYIGYSRVSRQEDKNYRNNIPYWDALKEELKSFDPCSKIGRLRDKADKALKAEIAVWAPDFDRIKALKIALNRAIDCWEHQNENPSLERAPFSIQDDLEDMYWRSKSYFKE